MTLKKHSVRLLCTVVIAVLLVGCAARGQRAPVQERASKPFDFDALRRFQQTLPMCEQSAVDLVRQMRDESRY